MRDAPRPSWTFRPTWAVIARAFASICQLAVSATLVTALPGVVYAQDPSVVSPQTVPTRSFPTKPGQVFGGLPKIDKTQPLYLQGDQLVYDNSGNRVTAQGNVEIFFNNYILTADQVIYDRSANTLTARGNVTLKEPSGAITRSDQITLTDDFRDGFVESLSVVGRDNSRITARRANRRGGNITEFEDGKFTPCRNDSGKPPLWCISAARVVHDQNAQTITYEDATFDFLGTPILAVPYFQHSDPSVKRRSGFLAPEASHSTELGFMLEVPYYFALSPSYDFLFHPMYTTRQGVLWQGDWRQKLAFGDIVGEYSVKFAAIDQDVGQLSGAPAASLDGWRGSVETRGRFSLSSWWKFGWDVTIESDDTFRRTYKLDNILLTDRVNSVYLKGIGERSYFSIVGYHFGSLLFNSSLTAGSTVHPVIDWNYVVGQPVLGGELSWNLNALSMSRTNAYGTGASGNMSKASVDVNWRRKLTDRIGITYTPFASLRGDVYQLDDVNDPANPGTPLTGNVTRGVATAGILAAYPWINHTASASHIIEPLGQLIVRTAKASQLSVPDEDARSLVFDDTNLFEVDKFSGYDRVETGTRANVGLQYTFQANAGGHARLLVGQSFHLSGQNPFTTPGQDGPAPGGTPEFNPANGLDSNRSDYVLAAYMAPSSIFRFVGQVRVDERDLSIRRTDLFGQIDYGPVFGQASYTFTGVDPLAGLIDSRQEILGRVGLRLTDNWSILASMRFDIDLGERVQDSFALRYSDDCFVLTASYNETFVEDLARGLTPDRSIMLRFELKHLGSFRYKTDILDSQFAPNQIKTD